MDHNDLHNDNGHTNSCIDSEKESCNVKERELISSDLSTNVIDAIGTLIRSNAKFKSDDLLVKLRNLAHENFELKDTLVQSNMALKQQMNFISQWNQQFGVWQYRRKGELDESEKKLNFLSQENLALKSTIANFKQCDTGSNFSDLDVLIQKLREDSENCETRLKSSLAENEILVTLRAKLEREVALLKSDLAARRSDYEKLNLQNEKLNCSMIDLSKKLNQRRRDQQHITRDYEQDDSLNLKKLLSESQVVNSSLNEQLRKAKNHVQSLEEELKSLRKSSPSPDNNVFNPSMLNGTASSTQLMQIDSNGRDTQLEGTNSEKESHSRQYLLKEIQRLKRELSETKGRSELSQINDHFYEAKLKFIQEQHDEATAKIISYEELVGTKNQEIARLKREIGQIKAQLREMHSESETIAVLRAQVEVYQGDFRAEREARESMASDRERLREEIKHLQMRNTQLVDELDSYQRKQFNRSFKGVDEQIVFEEPQRDLERIANSSGLKPESPNKSQSPTPDKRIITSLDLNISEAVDENLFYCPKCNKSFVQLSHLEEHVNRCLDQD